MAELLCVAFDLGSPDISNDPFVGFDEVRPLFVLNEESQRYEIAPNRQEFFARDGFPAEKESDTYRIFCLGGSTVQGRPFSIATAFSTWLRINLELAAPDTTWQVVNCGGISYASYRLVPILEECLTHQPDLIIICTGHNEFLEDRTYAPLREPDGVWALGQKTIGRLRLYRLFAQAARAVTGDDDDEGNADKPVLPGEVRTRLDDEGSLADYRRDPQWRAGVVAHYEANLRRMVALCRRADVPVILIRPPCDLADTSPFKSEHREGLSDAELSRWRSLIDEANAAMTDDLERAIELLEEAAAIDEKYAATFYKLGMCYEATNQPAEAQRCYFRARNLDVCPLRMPIELENALLRVASDSDAPLLDAFALIESRCPHRILSDAMLLDHVHPTFEGHQLISEALFDVMRQRGWVTPTAPAFVTGTRSDRLALRTAAYEAHMATLDEAYYLRGRRELEALRRWSRDRARHKPGE